eukprot:UN13184
MKCRQHVTFSRTLILISVGALLMFHSIGFMINTTNPLNRIYVMNKMDSKNCDNIYIDLGSNIGVQTRKLFEPNKYSKYKSPILDYFNKTFGSIDERRTKTCSFGFEANPIHEHRLQTISKCYTKKGWNTQFWTKAVFDSDNHIIPIYSKKNSSFEDWGAGITQRSGHDIVHNVSTIDIAKWIRNIVQLYEPKHV